VKLDQLRYFLEAARQEHLGRAARVLHVSPSTVSHAIAALEADLGRALFANVGKRVVLTDEGRRLAELGEDLAAHVERVRAAMARGMDRASGYFRVGATHGLAGAFVAPAWQELFGAAERVTLQLFSLRSAEVVAAAARREIDFGVCYSPLAHPEVERMTLYAGQLVFAVRRGHPATKAGRRDPLAALAGHPAALAKAFQGVDNCERHAAFARLGGEPRVALVFDSYEVAVAAATTSDAWTFLPDWIVARERGLVPVVARGPAAPYEVAMVWPKGRPLASAARELAARLTERLAPKRVGARRGARRE
jgi:LysR family cyn operon transcriptional activator